MPAKFQRDGIEFQYPENWRCGSEDSEGGWTVTVQSPGAAFLTAMLAVESPGMGALADQVMKVFRSEYKELDADPFTGTLAGLPTVGYDVEFICMDFTNTCVIRAISTGSGTLLLVAQSNDAEENAYNVLRAMLASLQIDEDG